jgi:hypothetical protein
MNPWVPPKKKRKRKILKREWAMKSNRGVNMIKVHCTGYGNTTMKPLTLYNHYHQKINNTGTGLELSNRTLS